MSIIKLTQTPVIDFSGIEKIGKQVQDELAKYNLENQIVTDDNLQDIKKLRTNLNKQMNDYETTRKAIKSAINKPYEDFEAEYKKHVLTPLKEAVGTLKSGIDEIEENKRIEKTQQLLNYFNSLVLENEIDFVDFEKVGLKITLSASIKSLEEEIDDFVHKVVSDLGIIDTQENKERILVQYQKHLDLNRAILETKEAITLEEELKNRQVEETPPIKTEPVSKIVEEELKLQFTVYGTLTQLKALKAYLEREGLNYE